MTLPSWTTSGFLRINRPDGVLGNPWPIVGGIPSAMFFQNYDGSTYTILGDAFGEQEGNVFFGSDSTTITNWNNNMINGLLPPNFNGGYIKIETIYSGEAMVKILENHPEKPIL